MTTTKILVQKDPKNLVPMDVTSAQRTVIAQNYTIYDLNADGTKSAPFGPTVVAGGGSMARTQTQLNGTPSATDIAIFNGVFTLDTDPTKRYKVSPDGTAYIVDGGGGGGISRIDAANDYSSARLPAEQSDINALALTVPSQALQVHAVPISGGGWDAAANNPTITSGTAPTDGIYCRTVTTAGTTNVDGWSVWPVGATITWNGTTWYPTIGMPQGPGLVQVDSSSVPTKLAGGTAAGPVMVAPDGTPSIGKVGTDVGAPIFYVCTQPFGIAPSGSTIGANGAAFTAGTAFIETYGPTGAIPYDGIWLYFPANAIDTSSAAGFYWVVMTSTTAGTIYQDHLSPGTASFNTKPSAPTAWTTNAGSTNAGTTSQTLGALITLPANTLGANGTFEIEQSLRSNASAGSKTFQPKFGGSNFGGVTSSTSASTVVDAVFRGFNANNTSRQRGVVKSTTGTPVLTLAPATAAVNTTASTTIGLDLKLATATDWVVCQYLAIKIWPSA